MEFLYLAHECTSLNKKLPLINLPCHSVRQSVGLCLSDEKKKLSAKSDIDLHNTHVGLTVLQIVGVGLLVDARVISWIKPSNFFLLNFLFDLN